jgi:DUF3078 family protein
MRKFLILSLFILFAIAGIAQDTTKMQGGTVSLNLGQGGSKNWAAGAEKFSFTIAAYVNLFANKRFGKYQWNNNLDLGFALVNTTSGGIRKTDDKIDLYSKLHRELSPHTSIAFVTNLRTQFADGFDYNYLGKGFRRRTSGFFAPAYLAFGPGLDWHPTKYFSIFFSPASGRFVIVSNQPKSYYFPGGVIPASEGGGFETPLAVLYGVDPARQVRAELGALVSINFNKEIFKNFQYKSRLDLYSNYLKTYKFTVTGPDELAITPVGPKPQNVDVVWNNVINMKVNKIINVTYNFDLIYDDDVRQFGPNKTSAGTQLRSLLAVGLLAKF